MRRLIGIASVVLFCCIFFFASEQAAWAQKKKNILIGTTQTSSSQYAYGVAVARAINMHVPELNANVVETGASVDNVKRLQAGQLDVGAIVTTKVMYEAWKGIGIWKDKPVSDLRMLWVYVKNAQYYVVREDSGVKELKDLNGKKFNPGMRGSATEADTKEIFEALGIKPIYHVGGTSDAISAFKDGRIVGYLKSGAGLQLDASTLDIQTMTKIRLLSMNPEEVKKVKSAFPLHPFVTVPTGQIKAIANSPECTTWAVLVCAVALKNLPDDLIYKSVKAFVKERNMIIEAYSPHAEVDVVKDTPEMTTIPLHNGAYMAYKELGANIPEKAIPPEAKK